VLGLLGGPLLLRRCLVTLHALGIGVVAFVLLLVALFFLIALAGLCSAALEVRRERRAGLEPTRPAWESRAKRRAIGSRRERARVLWRSLATRGMCWCGQGLLQEFPSLDVPGTTETGCAAWEAGDAEAIRRHDEAGGYQRVPLSIAEVNLARRIGYDADAPRHAR
jgi:hypothetical protein